MRNIYTAQLQWFIDFAYCDFDKLSSGEEAKLMDEIVGLSVSSSFDRKISHEEIIEISKSLRSRGLIDLESVERVKRFQKSFRDFFEKIMDKIANLPDFEESEWVSYEESDTILGIPLLPRPFPVTLEIEAEMIIPFEFRHEGDITKTRWRKDWREYAIISVKKVPVSGSEWALMHIFLELLSGMPQKFFRKCEECDRWFLHVTKRERRYCNNLCAARKSTRDRRASVKQENPAAYIQEQERNREKAHLIYKGKMRKINPNYKVERRPRKNKLNQ